ncbi:MAG: hypothetical protein RMJ84_03845 [Sandaracinaceae bacterium]|nr:hypothetical protein [Sandaracinaceae bacterium]
MSSREASPLFEHLLPGERVIWAGQPLPHAGRPLLFVVLRWSSLAIALSSSLFAILLHEAKLPGASSVLAIAVYAGIVGVASELVPRYTLDQCRFTLTNRRIIWSLGTRVRAMDRKGLSFTRLRWHHSLPNVGTIEFVRAVPFGPLMRQERITFHHIESPHVVLALSRGVQPSQNGDGARSLVEALDKDERILWGGAPRGLQIGWRNWLTALLGLVLCGIAIRYASVSFGALRKLEEVGLPVGSSTWWFFFGACFTTFTFMLTIGAGLMWWGFFRASRQSRDTEYLVTDRRVLIRRGLTELSLDRSRIVDLAEIKGFWGSTHLLFLLDGPEGRALGDSGVMRGRLPSPDAVPPIFFDLEDVEEIKSIFQAQPSPNL